MSVIARRPRDNGRRGAGLLSLLLVGGLLSAACETERGTPIVSATPTASATPTLAATQAVPAIAWRPCLGSLECGIVVAPLDHDRPDGETISVYVARLSASTPGQRIGSLVLDFGGPGGSGINALLDFSQAPQMPPVLSTLHERFDLVAFDRRATGHTIPIDCIDDGTKDAWRQLDSVKDPDWEALVRSSADVCAAKYAHWLPFVSTLDVARDLDLIRVAVDDTRLTYAGFSYGSLLGARYASLYPNRVRAMLLDGAVDPTLDLVAVGEKEAIAIEKSFDAFLEDCASSPDCVFRGDGDPGAAFDTLIADLDTAPLEVTGGHLLSVADVYRATQLRLKVEGSWPALARELEKARQGDGTDLLRTADLAAGRNILGDYGNVLEAQMAILCSDYSPPDDLATALEATAGRLRATAPRFGRNAGGLARLCAMWPNRPRADLPSVAASTELAILVIGHTGDPATPYEASRRMVEQLGSAVLVTREGYGHTMLLTAPNACLQDAVTRYLFELEVPPHGLTC